MGDFSPLLKVGSLDPVILPYLPKKGGMFVVGGDTLKAPHGHELRNL